MLQNEGGTTATLTSATGCRSYGVVYRLPRELISALDEFEEAPLRYRRQSLWVQPLGRRARQAATAYVGQPDWITETAQPDPGYVDLMARGAEAHGIPPTYVEWLRAAAADPVIACHPKAGGGDTGTT